ncbi:MAG TPA: tetratricopeptide repeat protein [Terriglobales bacterium]|nr:tetratricopeptide repeat protein [Terriglobales bacterium]
MKPRIFLALALLLAAIGGAPAWCQTAQISGKVVDKAGKPLADAQIVYLNLSTDKSFKVKTDKNGEFVQFSVPYGNYQIEILGPDGQSLFKKTAAVNPSTESHRLVIDLAQGTQKQTLSAKQIEALKQKNQQLETENALIAKYLAAQHDKNWQDAENILGELIALDPNRWEYQKSLADTQLNQGKYDEALATYEKTITAAQSEAAPNADPAKTKIAVSQMLTSEGNSYLKLHKNEQAIAAFSKAAEMSPNPGVAYFNLCATQYNMGHSEEALAACDKAIAADPTKADAYFIKGSVLIAESTTDAKGQLTAPAGTTEALKKYLELAPDGGHVQDVKQMLDFIGAKVDTTYKEKQK